MLNFELFILHAGDRSMPYDIGSGWMIQSKTFRKTSG